MNSTIIVVICIVILFAILIIILSGIYRANKANRESISTENVVCAGSVDNSYPATVKIKIPNDPKKYGGNISKEEMDSLSRFIVKGNSMQYAKINPNDLIYVKEMDLGTLRHNLPKITLLKFDAKSPKLADKKIRRTWSIIDSNISDDDFNDTLDTILGSATFHELRYDMGQKCPSNEILKRVALERLHNYKEAHYHNNEDAIEDLLLSTTFRTEDDCLEFSIHPASALQGVVVYVSHLLT